MLPAAWSEFNHSAMYDRFYDAHILVLLLLLCCLIATHKHMIALMMLVLFGVAYCVARIHNKNMIDLVILVLFGVAYCMARFQNQKHDRFDDTSVVWRCLLCGPIPRPKI